MHDDRNLLQSEARAVEQDQDVPIGIVGGVDVRAEELGNLLDITCRPDVGSVTCWRVSNRTMRANSPMPSFRATDGR